MDAGLTTITEKDIEKHRATAQSMVTRIIVLEDDGGRSATALAGTGRRFVSTVSAGGARRTREVELSKTIGSLRPGDQMLSIPQHTLLFRARRGLEVSLAIGDVFAQASDLESLQSKNLHSPLQGEDATRYISSCRRRPMSRPSPSHPTCFSLSTARANPSTTRSSRTFCSTPSRTR